MLPCVAESWKFGQPAGGALPVGAQGFGLGGAVTFGKNQKLVPRMAKGDGRRRDHFFRAPGPFGKGGDWKGIPE